MNIDILTKRQAQEYIKQEVARQLANFYKDLDKVRNQINLLKEEFICSQRK